MKSGILSLGIIALTLFASAQFSNAQSKTETRQYNKTMASPTLASCRKFLTKFPSSVYAEAVHAKLDTLLNVSPYSPEEAASIAAGFLPEGSSLRAFGYRKDAVDYVIGLCIQAPDLPFSSIRQFQIVSENGSWNVKECFDLDIFDGEIVVPAAFSGESSVDNIGGSDYMLFGYEYFVEGGTSVFGLGAYNISELSVQDLKFRGRVLADGNVEGRYNDNMVVGLDRPIMQYLLSELKKDSRFIVLDDSVIMTDDAIAWWLAKNPDAMTSATSLKFGVIPPESTLVQQYAVAKGKQNSSRYRAAMFDIRGYSVVVAFNKSTEEYVLVWAEPECKDHYRDRLLNNIYFQPGTSTLVLFYYKGKRTFEYHINLANKSIKR